MGRTILTVDDSAYTRQMIARVLTGEGYEVVQAGDGAEGCARARKRVVDLVITDWNMPTMGGLELIREVRKLPGYASVPIFVLSTDAGDEQKGEARSAGATGWVAKPFEPHRLLELIAKVLS